MCESLADSVSLVGWQLFASSSLSPQSLRGYWKYGKQMKWYKWLQLETGGLKDVHLIYLVYNILFGSNIPNDQNK